MQAKSCTSWTEPAPRKAKPVERAAMMSEWSPKIDRACVATVRADTWKTVGVSSPAILNMFGIMRRSPCDAVKVVARAPVVRAPWIAPEAPPSLCNSATTGMVPQMFFFPSLDH